MNGPSPAPTLPDPAPFWGASIEPPMERCGLPLKRRGPGSGTVGAHVERKCGRKEIGNPDPPPQGRTCSHVLVGAQRRQELCQTGHCQFCHHKDHQKHHKPDELRGKPCECQQSTDRIRAEITDAHRLVLDGSYHPNEKSWRLPDGTWAIKCRRLVGNCWWLPIISQRLGSALPT